MTSSADKEPVSPERLSLGESYRMLARLGLPVLVTQLGAILVGFVDTFMMSNYSTAQYAAAAYVNNLFVVPIVMQMGFAGGLTPLVGALFGRGDHRLVGRMMRLGMRLNVWLGLIVTAVMAVLYLFLGDMGQDPAIMPYVRSYYLTVLASIVFGSVFFCAQQMSNGVNDTATPMWVILGGNLLNVVGNYMLIYGKWGAPELGVLGAGLSTLNARIIISVVMVALVAYSRRYRRFRCTPADRFADPKAEKRRLLSTSWPVMIQSGVECFLWAFGAVVSGWFGSTQLAAYQLMVTLNQLGFMTYMSAATAVAVRVSNYAGCDDTDSMRITAKAGLHINLILGTLASAIFLALGDPIIDLLTPDAAVRSYAYLLILPLVLYQYCDAVQMTYGNALRGTSNVKPLLWTAVISYLVVGVPALLFLAVTLNMGSLGIYYCFSIALFIAAILYRRYFLRTLSRLTAAHL